MIILLVNDLYEHTKKTHACSAYRTCHLSGTTWLCLWQSARTSL
ncbi:hypothetical protein [Moraxella lacunata]